MMTRAVRQSPNQNSSRSNHSTSSDSGPLQQQQEPKAQQSKQRIHYHHHPPPLMEDCKASRAEQQVRLLQQLLRAALRTKMLQRPHPYQHPHKNAKSHQQLLRTRKKHYARSLQPGGASEDRKRPRVAARARAGLLVLPLAREIPKAASERIPPCIVPISILSIHKDPTRIVALVSFKL